MLAQTKTLAECQELAVQNYPLIKKYDLIAQTTATETDNVAKQWLPKISAYAQATLQSDVVTLPETMNNLLKITGVAWEGLKRDQYKIGFDVNQIIYDGGTIKSQKNIIRRQGDLQAAQNDVNIYAVRKRVNEIFFSILLANEMIKLNADRQMLLLANEKQLEAMLKGGVATESDYASVRAERLNVIQEENSLRAKQKSLLSLLSAFIGTTVSNVEKPASIPLAKGENYRPELRLLDAQIKVIDAQEAALNSQLMPKLGAFASGFYGYPGFDMYADMMNRRFSLNGIVGLKLSWDISPLYTRKGDKTRLQLKRETAETERATFLFNSKLEEIQNDTEIERFQQLIATDNEIIQLRSKVRKAYESKLRHGIIETTSLLQEITKENAAKTNLSTHEIELLKQLYDKKILLAQ